MRKCDGVQNQCPPCAKAGACDGLGWVQDIHDEQAKQDKALTAASATEGDEYVRDILEEALRVVRKSGPAGRGSLVAAIVRLAESRMTPPLMDAEGVGA